MHYSVCITDRKLGNNFLFFHLPESFLLSLGYSYIASYTLDIILCDAQCAFKFNVHIIEDIIFVASYIRRLSCTIHIFSTVNISIVKKSRKDEHVSTHHYLKQGNRHITKIFDIAYELKIHSRVCGYPNVIKNFHASHAYKQQHLQ